MVGKEVKVKKWQGKNGIIYFNGGLWKATSSGPLLPGDKAIIEKVDGLLVSVKPRNDGCNRD
jgi:membrane-bound ClpP family serine protease